MRRLKLNFFKCLRWFGGPFYYRVCPYIVTVKWPEPVYPEQPEFPGEFISPDALFPRNVYGRKQITKIIGTDNWLWSGQQIIAGRKQ